MLVGIRKRRQVDIELIVARPPHAAVAVNRLLPVRGGVQHRLCLLSLERPQIARARNRHFGDHEWLGLHIQPSIDSRNVHL